MALVSDQKTIGISQVHLSPRWIIDALGPFDLDPCAADPRPWDCAEINLTQADAGLRGSWTGRVWLNPPFDRYQVGKWIRRLAEHGHGTCPPTRTHRNGMVSYLLGECGHYSVHGEAADLREV